MGRCNSDDISRFNATLFTITAPSRFPSPLAADYRRNKQVAILFVRSGMRLSL